MLIQAAHEEQPAGTYVPDASGSQWNPDPCNDTSAKEHICLPAGTLGEPQWPF